ncbi:hypothetical protein [Cellulomonas wangsupingiae]|uniref:Uncharacterized protein n=1 Tax=Cellulomonas wangsupingiae TaxID=2968085 RepID=A0ABY5K891_9CELL|nr:hypothetical protein [Cellulomonas wangsupingiae]MCC2334537.1 hypothetical protein [Cellulomonas wangsupingiae]UUI66494.1 hypothetical protein NP075_07250 [Cellulomonas wangsupingiae]
MTRPSDWYPLAVTDPVAGDPQRVRAAGEEYAAVARQIEAAVGELRAIAAAEGGSLAVDEVRTRAARLAATIERAHGRYAVTGEALLTYAGALAHAQEASLRAHARAVSALHAQDEALVSVAWWTRLAERAADPAVRDQYVASAEDARADLLAADARLDRARADLRVVVAQVDGAVDAARATIRGATVRDDLHDTAGQEVGGRADEGRSAVWSSADEISAGSALLSVVLRRMSAVDVSLGASMTVAEVLTHSRDPADAPTGRSGDDAPGLWTNPDES